MRDAKLFCRPGPEGGPAVVACGPDDPAVILPMRNGMVPGMNPILEQAIRDAREGRLDAALATVRMRVRLQPKDVDAMQMLALLLVRSGRRDEAMHQIGRASCRERVFRTV